MDKEFETCIICGMPETGTGDNPVVKDYELIECPEGWVHRICVSEQDVDEMPTDRQ